MKELSIADLLRYLSAGAMALILYYIADPVAASAQFALLNEVSTLLLTLMLGTIIYWMYRPLVFNSWLFRLKNSLIKGNYRTFLHQRCGVTSQQAERIFVDLRDNHLVERYANLAVWSAGIHQLYMGFTLTLLFAIGRIVAQDWTKVVWFLVLSALLLWAGLRNDANYERRELTLLLSLEPKLIDEACDRAKAVDVVSKSP